MESRERQLRILMAVYSLIFLICGLILLFYSSGVLRLINWITNTMGFSHPLDIPAHPFWAMVNVSLLLTLALMCYLAFRNKEVRLLVSLVIFAKYVSSICLIGYFAVGSGHPPGFLIGSLVDASLGTVALIFLLRAGPAYKSPG